MTRLPLQVLVHGGGGTGAEMEPLAEALRPFADVRLPTLAGHGGRPIPERFTIREFAEDLVAYFDREGIERAFVTGYSFGAYVVLYLARHFPHRLHGACSLAGKFVFDARTVSHWNHIASEERLTRAGSLEGAAMAMAHLPQNWLVIARRFRDLFTELGVKPALSDADLASISIPVMLVSADRDQIVPWQETQALGALIPGVRIAKFEGSAHPLADIPRHAIARAISQWMHDVENRGQTTIFRGAENSGLSPVSALLFDLGGLIMGIDWERAFAHWAKASGKTVEEIRRRYSFDAAYERHERGEIGELEYYAALRDSLGIGIGDEAFRAGWGAIFTQPIEENLALVHRVAERVPVYAFSNSNAAHQLVWSKQFEAALKPFRKVFVSSELGARKPERESFERISRKIGVPLANILFFDDTLENVEGAMRAGLQAVHVKGPQDVRDALRPWLQTGFPPARE